MIETAGSEGCAEDFDATLLVVIRIVLDLVATRELDELPGLGCWICPSAARRKSASSEAA